MKNLLKDLYKLSKPIDTNEEKKNKKRKKGS